MVCRCGPFIPTQCDDARDRGCDRRPSARIVLLKQFDAGGFVFVSGYASRKGSDLSANPCAALVFFWEPLERQIHIRGNVEKVSREESESLFHARPRGADQRMGVPSERSDFLAQGAGGTLEENGGRIRGWTDSLAGLLGRVSAHPIHNRILARQARTFARPHRL